MFTVKNNDQNKMNLAPSSFHSFLNWLKTAKSTKTLKFSHFEFVCKKLRVITGVGYLVLQICWRWVEKNHFSNFMDFNPLQTKVK